MHAIYMYIYIYMYIILHIVHIFGDMNPPQNGRSKSWLFQRMRCRRVSVLRINVLGVPWRAVVASGPLQMWIFWIELSFFCCIYRYFMICLQISGTRTYWTDMFQKDI